MDKNPFLKYMIDDNRENYFHTSRHAKVQSGSAMGSTSAETFAQRRKIDQNRTRVRKYNDSRLVAQAMNNKERAKVYTPPEKPTDVGVGGAGVDGAGAGARGAGGAGAGASGAITSNRASGSRPPMPPMPRR